MLDVVFIMLIFFIVTTSFVKETGISIYKASQTQAKENKVKAAIIKLETDNITVNGVSTKLNGIQSLLANLRASNPDIKAQILSAKDIKTGDLVQTIHQIKINNIDSYSVSTF
jgi:biopolymer transport protein ExbD